MAMLKQLFAYNVLYRKQAMVTKRTKRSRALDVVLELGIAITIVAVVILGALFYATFAQANWMPSPESLKQGAWLVGATGIGIAYVYLAYSTRRLKRLVADKPQLQQLTALMNSWYKDAAIAGMSFLVAFALLWRMLGEHGGINVAATIQVVTGVVLMLGGLAVLRIENRLRSHSAKSKPLANALTVYVLPGAAILYGAARVCSGIYLFAK
jgi:hypothetical protein